MESLMFDILVKLVFLLLSCLFRFKCEVVFFESLVVNNNICNISFEVRNRS